VGYVLGIDLGTTFTAAAVMRDGRAEVVPLGNHAATIPTMVFLREDDTVLIGDAAERRGANEPTRLAREFKRRLGDTAPIMLDRTPFSADRLLGLMLRQILADVSVRQGGAPDLVAITHPANWGEYKIDLLRQAVETAGIRQAVYISEPVAAALQYAAGERVEPGETVAVYDLGGGTFDAAVLRKVPTGFELLGRPQGIERLGGIDFDEAVLTHVRKVVGNSMATLDANDPSTRAAFSRLRQECVLAKETLSADSDATVPVLLPNVQTQVRITRSEFEDMVRPIVRETIDSLQRAVESAGVAVKDLKAVLLAGGSSRIPLAADMVRTAIGRPVVSDTHPKHAVALGAARFAAGALASGSAAPTVLSGSILGSHMPLPAQPGAPTPPPPPPATVAAPPPPAAVPPAPRPAPAPAPAMAATRVDTPVVPASPAATPASPRKRPLWPLATVAAVVVALVVAGVLALGGGDDPSDAGDTTTAIGSATTGGLGTDTTTANSGDTGTTASGTDTTVFDDNLASLVNVAESDMIVADAFVGTYVVQLAANYPGNTVDGVAYDSKKVIEEHYILRSDYSAILVSSLVYNFQFDSAPVDGWFLTVLPQSFATEADANQWCADAGISGCIGRLFQPRIEAMQNLACNDAGDLCVGISSAIFFDGTFYVTYQVTGFEPEITDVSGDQHVHFFFGTQDPTTVGNPNSGLWYVWDRAAGGGELVFTGFGNANLFDYGYEAGTDICITPAQHDHSLVDSAVYYCYPLPGPGE
jgi:molecular chaperone DnaK